MEKQTLNYVDTFNRIAIANYKKSASDSDMEDERIRKELLPKREINYLDGIDVYLGGEKIAWSSYEKKEIERVVFICEECGSYCTHNGTPIRVLHKGLFPEAIKTFPKYLMCDTCNH